MSEPVGDSAFLTTRWSLIQRAVREGEEQPPALDDLCRSYWYPLYAFARRQGQTSADAQDHVQGFFLDLLDRDALAVADPDRGRFRNFLLTSFRFYTSKVREAAKAQKRGGAWKHASLLEEEGETRFAAGGADGAAPEHLFLRDWTMSLLDLAMEQLAEDYAKRDQSDLFEALCDYLSEHTAPPYEELAAGLGRKAGAVRVALHRLRGRYRNGIRSCIADTLDNPSEDQVERELQDLLSSLSSG